jgi:TatD DNase family protein
VIDTHCHLTFEHFAGRVDAILAEARAVGVRGFISVATTPGDAVKALAIAERHDDVWFSAGVHPLYSDEDGSRDWDTLMRAAAHPKCVAWGELGLDNHYRKPPRDVQIAVLEEQLAMIEGAKHQASGTPIIVHCREAFDDLLATFRSTTLDPSRFVFHCFTGGPDEARKVIDFGAWISFTGVVTFRNAPEVAAAAKVVPLDRMMAETDAPFLSPEPVRTARPNVPKHVAHIYEHIANLRSIQPAELERTLDANAERFFGITLPIAGPG